MKKYLIEIIGGGKVYCTLEDVKKIILALDRQVKLVLIGGQFLNPACIARIARVYNAGEETETIGSDEDLMQLTGNSPKQLR